MSVLDRLKDAARRIVPENHGPGLLSASSINGHVRIVPFEGEVDAISPAAMVFHASQIFFTFLAMCCFAAVASFQAKWHIGPSDYRLARALKELRVLLILTCTGVAELLLIRWAGCKDASKDPHSSLGKDFRSQLPGWCRTKKAGTVFSAFWACSLGLILLDLRSGKISRRSHDPPFSRPSDDPRDDDAESILSRPVNRGGGDRDGDGDGVSQSPFADSNRYRNPSSPSTAVRTSRSSMDPYGAFSDPAPSGYPPSATAPGARASSLSPTRGGETSRPTAPLPKSYPNNSYVPPEPRVPPRPARLDSTTPSTPPSYTPSHATEPKTYPPPSPQSRRDVAHHGTRV
ncbi:hypothetical protein BS47DRAFT_1373458 [Hydnum rufescens UP504]|uniref:MARVEL domain-containing protein n=1 Tax=Hydnum rufescens UP504 TaxID=1448309 RepID=A0A9P6ARS2_9AGAM|nr:hypothetical protein BS47DRAFT_1373458 [Hydnum rufescens UP504]